MSTRVEQFTEPVAFHGEGPVWAAAWDGLRLVDMLAGDILCLDADGGLLERLHVGTVAAAFRPRHTGGMVVGVERGFALVDRRAPRGDACPSSGTTRAVRMNDGATDPDGRFYCGSMAYDMTPGAGRLYRLEPGGAVTVVVPSATCSNGLAWTADGRTAYYVDTHDAPDRRPRLRRGRRADRSPALRRGAEGARPPGRAHGGPRGRRLGRALRRLGGASLQPRRRTSTPCSSSPVTQVTACTFGGPDLAELYITTSRETLAEGDQPPAGSVYVARPGVGGLPVVSFAGIGGRLAVGALRRRP